MTNDPKTATPASLPMTRRVLLPAMLTAGTAMAALTAALVQPLPATLAAAGGGAAGTPPAPGKVEVRPGDPAVLVAPGGEGFFGPIRRPAPRRPARPPVPVPEGKAPPLANLLPADTHLYIGWCGTDRLPAAWADTPGAKITGDAEFRAWMDRAVADMLRRWAAKTVELKADQPLDNARTALKVVTGVAESFRRNPSALARRHEGGPTGHVQQLLVTDAGPAGAAALVKSLDTLCDITGLKLTLVRTPHGMVRRRIEPPPPVVMPMPGEAGEDGAAAGAAAGGAEPARPGVAVAGNPGAGFVALPGGRGAAPAKIDPMGTGFEYGEVGGRFFVASPAGSAEAWLPTLASGKGMPAGLGEVLAKTSDLPPAVYLFADLDLARQSGLVGRIPTLWPRRLGGGSQFDEDQIAVQLGRAVVDREEAVPAQPPVLEPGIAEPKADPKAAPKDSPAPQPPPGAAAKDLLLAVPAKDLPLVVPVEKVPAGGVTVRKVELKDAPVEVRKDDPVVVVAPDAKAEPGIAVQNLEEIVFDPSEDWATNWATRFGDASRVGVAVGFAGGRTVFSGWASDGKLGGDAPVGKITDELLSAVPQDAEYFVASGLPLTGLARLTGGGALLAEPQWPAMFKKFAGADWAKDVQAHLGPWVAFNNPGGGGRLIMGAALVVEVRNEAALRKTETKLLAALRKVLTPGVAKVGNDGGGDFIRLDLGGSRVRLLTQREGPYTVNTLVEDGGFIFSRRLYMPSWCLTEGHLVFGINPQTVRATVRRLTGDPDPKSYVDRPEAAAPKAATRPDAVLVMGADLARGLEGGAGLLEWLGPGLLEKKQVEPLVFRPALLPGADLIAPHLGPAWGVWSAEAGGLRWRGDSPVPVPAEGMVDFISELVVDGLMDGDFLRRFFQPPEEEPAFENVPGRVPGGAEGKTVTPPVVVEVPDTRPPVLDPTGKSSTPKVDPAPRKDEPKR